MFTIEEEIASQPGVWRRAADRARGHAAELPGAGDRVAMVGCGTSRYIGQSIAALRESLALGETDAFAASEFPSDRGYDRVIAISRSGTTTEVMRALQATSSPSIALTAVAGTPVAEQADAAIVLEFADEEAVVQTRFATAVLSFLRAWLGGGARVAAAAAAVEAGSGEIPVEATRFSHFVFLGAGESVGLACEAALKLQEAAGVWTEAFPAMEYRHGPLSAAGPATLVWPLGDVDPSVLAAAEETGATVVLSADDPAVELVTIQRLAVELAVSRGRDPSFPAHLSRSVVLG